MDRSLIMLRPLSLLFGLAGVIYSLFHASCTAAADITFAPAVYYAAGQGVVFVTATDCEGNPIDLDGDGDIDLVVANYESDDVSVLLNLGDGTFANPVHYDVQGSPESLTVVDFNGDRAVDIAVANFTGNSFSILLGNGDGTFGVAQHYLMGFKVRAIAAGDLNSDGSPDLALTLWNAPFSDRVRVFLNNGGAVFQQTAVLDSGYGSPVFIEIEDLNGDGSRDISVLKTNMDPDEVVVWLNSGDATFGAGTAFPTGPYYSDEAPTWLATGDFDQDQDLDIVVSLWSLNSTASVRLLLNLGNGTFSAPVYIYAGGLGESVDPGDFDRDGDLDLALARTQDVRILQNDGGGVFIPSESFPVNPTPRAVTTGDFDGDSNLDLATANVNYGENVSILLNTTVGPNNPPILTPIGNKSVNEGQLLTFTISAMDPDQDVLSLSAQQANGNPLPSGASFTDQGNGTGTFSWTPNYTQAGTYLITFTASDGELEDTETITITVRNATAPRFISAPKPSQTAQ